MAPSQKHLLTSQKSRVGKIGLITMLREDIAWLSIPREKREMLYTMLPAAGEGEPPRDPDIHPLRIEKLKTYIEEEFRRWSEDLTDGREMPSWRNAAMQAGKDHVDGKWDEWKAVARDEYWGKPDEEAATGGEDEGEGIDPGPFPWDEKFDGPRVAKRTKAEMYDGDEKFDGPRSLKKTKTEMSDHLGRKALEKLSGTGGIEKEQPVQTMRDIEYITDSDDDMREL